MRLVRCFFSLVFPLCLVFLGLSLFVSGCTNLPIESDGLGQPSTQPVKTVKVLTPAAEAAIETAGTVGTALTTTGVPPLVQLGGLVTALAGLFTAWNQAQKRKVSEAKATAAQARCEQITESHKRILEQMTAALKQTPPHLPPRE